MKKRLSIPALWVRMTFWGALAVVFALTAAELVLLRLGLAGLWPGGEVTRFADYADRGHIGIVYRAALAAMVIWFFFSASARHATLGRLECSETACTLWHAGVCLGWLVILLAAQIGTVLIAYGWFRAAIPPAAVSGQSLAIAFYSNGRLHSLLPLSDWAVGLLYALIYVTVAFSVAVDCHKLRLGSRFPLPSVLAAEIPEVSFGSYWGKGSSLYVLTIAACVLILVIQAVRLGKSGEGRADG